MAPGTATDLEAGGFGVFDPGINALSIVTKIMPDPVFVKRADLQFPANWMLIAADLAFPSGDGGGELRAVFDWRQTGPQSWDIEIETEAGATEARQRRRTSRDRRARNRRRDAGGIRSRL